MNNQDIKNEEAKTRAGDVTRVALRYLFLSIWAVLVLFPFYWMLLTSIKSYGSYNAEYVPKFYTLNPTIANYVQAFTAVPLAKYFLNTQKISNSVEYGSIVTPSLTVKSPFTFTITIFLE